MKVLLTADEVAALLRVSKRWVMSHSTGKQQPKIPYLKLGREVRFLPDAIDRFARGDQASA